jgi:hypothetical protein
MERPDEYGPDLFYDADPAVIDAVIRLRERNPCGSVNWATPAVTTSPAREAAIRPPVLLVIGAEDKIWFQDGWALQAGALHGKQRRDRPEHPRHRALPDVRANAVPAGRVPRDLREMADRAQARLRGMGRPCCRCQREAPQAEIAVGKR